MSNSFNEMLMLMLMPCPSNLCDGSGMISDDGTEGSVEQKCICAIDEEFDQDFI